MIPHVLERGKKRGVTEDQIRLTVEAPDFWLATRPNAKSGAERRKHFRSFARQKLCVVVECRGKDRIAITTYWKVP